MLAPYCVLYQDTLGNRREFCCYAFDAYHARLEAEELVGSDTLKKILAIRKEETDFDW